MRPVAPGCSPSAPRRVRSPPRLRPASAASRSSRSLPVLACIRRFSANGRHPDHRARFVEQVDRANPAAGNRADGVRPASRPLQPPPACKRRCGAPRSAFAAPAGCEPSPRRSARPAATFWNRRASARSFSICLNSSNVVEPTTLSPPDASTGFSSVARSIVPPVVAPAPTMLWSSSMKRIGLRALRERVEHGLEPLFEVAAEARAGEQRRRVEREDFRARQRLGHVGLPRSRCASPSAMRGLADARIPDEHGAVLPPTAEDLHRALQFALAADQRVEQPGGRALREVHRVGRKRVARHRGHIVAARLLRPFRNGVVVAARSLPGLSGCRARCS